MVQPARLIAANGFVGVPGHDVDARFAPPAQIQRRDAVAELARVIFAQKEVHVVELDGVSAVAVRPDVCRIAAVRSGDSIFSVLP